MTLERMNDFFAARLAGYDEHMMSEIEVLRKSGFPDARIMRNWGATYTLLARR